MALQEGHPLLTPVADPYVLTSKARPYHDLLAHHAHVIACTWRLESGRAAPGIDMLDRQAALGKTITDLFPAVEPADGLGLLRSLVRRLFERIMVAGDRENFWGLA